MAEAEISGVDVLGLPGEVINFTLPIIIVIIEVKFFAVAFRGLFARGSFGIGINLGSVLFLLFYGWLGLRSSVGEGI